MKPHNFKDLSNKKFSRLTVRYLAFVKKHRSFWSCLCQCGNITLVPTDKLLSGYTKSCGCLHKESVTSHGMSYTRFYRIWHAMKTRTSKGYAKGKICKEWGKFENFYTDMFILYEKHAKKYGENYTTIDRINNSEGYLKTNCRWATYKVQNNNLHKNRYVDYKGKKITISNLYDKLNPVVAKPTFSQRVLNYGWPIDRAVQTPARGYRQKSK